MERLTFLEAIGVVAIGILVGLAFVAVIETQVFHDVHINSFIESHG